MKEAEKVLKEIEKKAETQFLPIVGPRKGRTLISTIRKTKPKRVLEIGTLIGYSAILIGKELEETAQLITIEIHPDEAAIAEENIKKAKLQSIIKVIVGDALTVIPHLKDKFDTVFIDAEKTEYYDYLKLLEPKLHKGAIVVADNAGIFANQMRDYLNYVRCSGNYASRYIKIGDDGLEVSIKT